VLGVQPDHARARALGRRFTQSDTPSGQLQREQVAAVHAESARPASIVPKSALAKSSVPTSRVVAPMPVPTDHSTASTTSAAPIAISPTAKAASRSGIRADTKPYPDPLVPRTVNQVPAPRASQRPRARSFGAPIDNNLPKAGLAGASSQVDAIAPPAEANVSARVDTPASRRPDAGTTSTDHSGEIVAVDQFDRVASREPVYPRNALRTHTSGWVELEFTITATGTVRDIEVVDAEPTGVFEHAASDALAAWRFKPRTVNGQPVAQRSTITMRFDVDD
jgi:protein TonB